MLCIKTLAALAWGTALTAGAQTFVTPKLGGGQVAAEMVHINIFYDDELKRLQAIVDDYGIPELRALEPGYSFDPAEAFVVLNGRAYNAQYGWNAGGLFTIPPGAAIWVEALDGSRDLEVYEGSGRFASYAPVFGTDGSPRRWKWSGVMVHNTYAVHSSTTSSLFAEYQVYFGDAVTGERTNFEQYGCASVRLEWTTLPLPLPLPLEFGAVALTNGAPLCLLKATALTTNSGHIVNLKCTDTSAERFEANVPMTALAATPAHGGPVRGHALPGSKLQLQVGALRGPAGGQIHFLENGTGTFTVDVGEARGTNLIGITESAGGPETDPYGNIQGRRLVATKPGLYGLTFRVLDTSTNGASGGSRHAPSEYYHLYLQAGVTIASLNITNENATVMFGGECGKQFLLEGSPRLGAGAAWDTLAGPLAGTNYLQTVTRSLANTTATFFRLRTQ
jgi:hypothetical protein